MSRLARHAVVTGRVQGVFFRQSAVEKARGLGVSGWVRNCADGSVEARLSGERDAVEAMTDWLRHGPPSARVERVEVDEVKFEATSGFEIRQ